jgi:hypothetical protein
MSTAAHTKIKPGPYGPFLIGDLFQEEPESYAGKLRARGDVSLQGIVDDCLYVWHAISMECISDK